PGRGRRRPVGGRAGRGARASSRDPRRWCPARAVEGPARMHVLTLLFTLLAACSSATALAAVPPAPARPPADPGALAALARDTAVALGLVVPALRDRLILEF